MNVELTSPPDFIPELPGWRDRSPFVLEEGNLAVHHLRLLLAGPIDDRAVLQTGSRRRGEMLARGLVDAPAYVSSNDAVEPQLYRYPAINSRASRSKVEAVLGHTEASEDDA